MVGKYLPFRAFCVEDLKNIDDVRCLMSVSCHTIIGDDASSAIIITDYDHHTKISGKSVYFRCFMCVLGTVVSSYMVSCDFMEKDV